METILVLLNYHHSTGESVAMGVITGIIITIVMVISNKIKNSRKNKTKWEEVSKDETSANSTDWNKNTTKENN